jgi:hypothetical protein
MDLAKMIKECIWLETLDDIESNLRKLLAEAERIPPPREVEIYGSEVSVDGRVVDVIDDTRYIIRTDKVWIIFDTEDPYNVHAGETLEEAYKNLLRSSIRKRVEYINELFEKKDRYGKAYMMSTLMREYDDLAEKLEIYKKAEGGKLKFSLLGEGGQGAGQQPPR